MNYFGISSTMDARILCEIRSLHTQPLTIQLCWNNDDPLTVTLTTDPDGRYPTTWTLAREMLAMGMQKRVLPAGGDISVLPRTPGFPRTMTVCLHVPPDPTASILIDRVDMQMFLERTFQIVPLGDERIDFDAALVKLLDEEAAS